ncbi:MAG: hypothetical protein Q9168_004253 [Polycauliona sp. 1 TL-2023]
MDIMGPWLSATIKQDLDRVLADASSQPLATDDGSTLQVKASKPGVVQIIKQSSNLTKSTSQWERYDDLTAWISDSTVRLKAVFVSKAATQHEKRTGKRITEETVGNIIQLQNADIIASYVQNGPRTKKVTLLINNFKVIGSDTTGQIGNPRPFDNTPEFEELLQKLAAFRATKENTNCARVAPEAPEKASVLGARLGNVVPVNPDGYESQQLFSQVPSRHVPTNAAAIADPQSLSASGSLGWAHKQTNKLSELLKAKSAPSALTKSAADTVSFVTAPPNSVQIQPKPREADAPIMSSKSMHRVRKKVKQKKIRSRDLRISKDQQDLLDSEDSWLPAKPGRRDPVANVPPAILEEITESMRSKAAKHDSADGEEGTAEDSPEGVAEPWGERQREETAWTQPEVSISTQEWPASPGYAPRLEPEQYKLPPDSSPINAEDMDLESDSKGPSDIGSPIRASSCDNHKEQTQVPCSTPAEGGDSVNRESVVIDLVGTDSDEDDQENTMTSCAGSPASESEPEELETSVLLKLNELYPPASEPSHTQEVPSTAIQPRNPYLQVKRTPYGAFDRDESTCTDDQTYPAAERFSSPSKRRRTDESGRSHNVEDHEDQSRTPPVVPARIHDPDISSSLLSQIPNSVEEIHLAHMTQHGASSTQDPEKPAVAAVASELIVDSLDSQHETESMAHHPLLSPYVSKRRKLHKASINFGFSQDEIPIEDPSVTARRYREEYMAQRKVSHSEARTSPYNEVPKPQGDENAQTMTHEQSEVIADHVEQSLDTLEAAGDPDPAPYHHEASQDETSGSSQRPGQHPDATSSEGTASPLDPVKSPIVISEADSSPEPDSQIDPTSQRPIMASIEKPHSVPENSDIHSSLQSVSTKLEAISSAEISQQSNMTGQAQSLPELMTPALSHTGLPDPPTVAQDTDMQPAIYLQFRSAYPEYGGSKEDFLGMCKKIEQLFRCDRMEHRSLWDDFVIRYQTDYPQYLERCVKNFEDPKTYERFYHDEVDGPKFQKRVLLPNTLAEALPLGSLSHVVPEWNSVDDVAVRESPGAKPSPQPTLSSRSIPSPGYFSDAFVETSQRAPETSSGLPQIQEEWQRMRHSEDPMANSPVKGRSDEYDVPEIVRTDKPVESRSSPSSTPLPVETRLAAKGPESMSPRSLPWLRDTTAPSTNSSKQNSPADQYSRKCRPERPLPTTSPIKDKSKSANMPWRALSKDEKDVPHRSHKAAPKQLRPVLLEHLHTAKTRGTDIPFDDATPSSSRGPPKLSQVDVPEVDDGSGNDPTSLRGFTKFYQAIRPGRGNSWAQAQAEEGKDVKAKVKGDKASKMRSIDVMSWRL